MICGCELWAESCSSMVEFGVVICSGLSVFLTSGGGSLLRCWEPTEDEEEEEGTMEGVEMEEGEGITKLGGG